MNRKIVHGVGVNDSVTHVYQCEGGRQLWKCQYYSTWQGMLKRCYSTANHRRQPTYVGCSVTTEWLMFSVFREWMQSQPWEGNHLDKDILFPGNRVYSSETCVFVPPELNKFFGDKTKIRGNFPTGVSWDKKAGKIRATCSNPFICKREFLGYFEDPASAHEAWRARKHQHALRYADMQTDQRIATALRTKFSTGAP